MKIVLIAIILSLFFFIIISPALFGKRLSEYHDKEFRKCLRYNGPKTDERINRMLAESIELLKGLGVPISGSIAPEVKLSGSHSCFGMCCPKGSRKYYMEYDYYIELSGFTLNNTEKCLRNVLIHELLHTVPGGLRHTGQWRVWADYVCSKTEYTIRSHGGDETEEDIHNLIFGKSI